jgi:putative hydrolase of the HAD superfamily
VIDWDALKGMAFDVGGILLLPRPDLVADRLTESGFAAPADEDRYRLAHYAGAAAVDVVPDEADVSSFRSYVTGYVAGLGFDGDEAGAVVEALLPIWRGFRGGLWTWPDPAGVRLLADVACLVPTAIVSNADGQVARALLDAGICQEGPGSLAAVTRVVDSTLVGVQKPDPAIFRHALDALGLEAHEVLYLGDTYEADVVGARGAGLPVVQLDPLGCHAGRGHETVRDHDELRARLPWFRSAA